MPKKLIIAFATFAITIAALSATYAQQKPESEQTKDDGTVASGLRGKVFELKHRNSKDLCSIASTLGSGVKGSTVFCGINPNVITVRDYPENIAVIEEALKRLDAPLPPAPPSDPAPKPPNIELYGYILLASNSEGPNSTVPANIKDVLPQLANTLSYKNYQLLATIVQRTSVNSGGIDSMGSAAPPDKLFTANYRLNIDRINPERPNDYSSIYLQSLSLGISPYSNEDLRYIGNGEIKTRLSIRDGEKVVVGTANMKDKAIILVLTAKILK